jgi:hypothetical protein
MMSLRISLHGFLPNQLMGLLDSSEDAFWFLSDGNLLLVSEVHVVIGPICRLCPVNLSLKK